MKKTIQLLTIYFCLMAFASSGFAQTPKAEKIEEFGPINCNEYLARMRNVYTFARNEQSSKIYVFVYEGKAPKYKRNGELEKNSALPQRSLAKTKINSMKELLSYWASLENFVFVEAGFRENFKVEFWTVPNGVIPPKPAPTLTKMKYRRGTPEGFCTACP